MGSSVSMESAPQWEDLQTTPACSIIVRPSSIHCFTCCCCCPSTMRCTGPLRSPRSNPVSSEAWRTSDRNEVKMGLGTARAPKGADAARTMEAGMRIAGWDGMGPRCAPTKNKTALLRLTSSHIQGYRVVTCWVPFRVKTRYWNRRPLNDVVTSYLLATAFAQFLLRRAA